MKQIMCVTNRKVVKDVPLIPGIAVNVHVSGLSGADARLLNRFIVQSIAVTADSDVSLVVLTKDEATLLMEWNTSSGEVRLNYINGSVRKHDFQWMDVIRGSKLCAVSPQMTYLAEMTESGKEPISPGIKLSSSSANYVVEYVTSDLSVVLQSTRIGSDRNKVYPTKTILVGAKNQEFWKSLDQKIEMVEI